MHELAYSCDSESDFKSLTPKTLQSSSFTLVYGHTLRVTPDFLSKGEPVNLN